MVGITLPRELRSAGLFTRAPAPTIGDVMSREHLPPSGLSGNHRGLELLRSKTGRAILGARFG
jgi:hypothetical protein